MGSGDNSIRIPAPPPIPAPVGRAGWMSVLPALGGLGGIGLLAMAPRSPMVYLAGGLFLLATVGMIAGAVSSSRSARRDSRATVRVGYLAQLEACRGILRADAQRLRARESVAQIEGAVLRVPLGRHDTARVTELELDDDDRADPFCRRRARALLASARIVRAVPVRLQITDRIGVYGDHHDVLAILRETARAVVQALDDSEIRIAVLAADPAAWSGMIWAPQHRHPTRRDECGALRLIAAEPEPLRDLLDDVLVPTLLLADRPVSQRDVPATWIVCAAADLASADIVCADGRLRLPGRDPEEAEAPGGGPAALETAARAAASAVPADAVAIDPTAEIAPGPLRPLIGTSGARPLVLDLREAGEGGSGPHGLLIGATGSGKSELLRLIVCRLLEHNDASTLSLAFVDYKGGATFAPFAQLPQVSALITNLQDEPGLLNRARVALSAELRRRQQVIAGLGAGSITELPSGVLPRLVIVVDEFSELLVQEPEMIDVLAQIGRLGRSLGVHLLVASQRLDEGRLKGLDSHLSYRIALRTQSAVESRAVIGSGDAAALPSAPGHGYLAAGGATVRFRAGYSLAPTPERSADDGAPAGVVVLHYENGPEAREAASPSTPSVLDAALARAGADPGRARPIWVDPPAGSPEHRELYDDLRVREGRGFGSLAGAPSSVRLGWVDRPERQSIEVCELDLAGGRGHVGIVGATRSGASGTLHAALVGVALRRTPREASLLVVDLSGGALRELRDLPHTGAYADASDPEQVRRIISYAVRIVDARERGSTGDPAVYLAVDGIARLRSEFDDVEPALVDIARRGLRVGVHVLCTAHRWLDIRAPLRDLLGTRIELRLGDPVESEIDRAAARLVPRGRPGRGLTPDGQPLYVAHDGSGRRHQGVIAQIARAWAGPRAGGPVELPPVITPANLAPSLLAAGVCVAVDRASRQAIALDDDVRFALVIGDPGSGRTSVLRSIADQEGKRGSRLVVLDPRRTLLGGLPDDAVLGYAPTPAAAEEALAGLVEGLRRRMPTADLPPEQLRARSWWDGPPLHLIVDDYDLLTVAGSPLGSLRPLLPYAADLGLRVTIARRTAGAARALHDDVLSVMRDLGAAGLLLGSAGDEGPLLGVRPRLSPWGRGTLVVPGRPPIDAQAVVLPAG